MSCAHRHITWPRGPVGSMRVACLDCAASLPYNWERMAIGEKEKRQVSRVPGLCAAAALLRLLRGFLGLVARSSGAAVADVDSQPLAQRDGVEANNEADMIGWTVRHLVRQTGIAFVPTYNEADMIGWTVRHLVRQGLRVHIIDCCSTDGTVRLAAEAGATVETYHAPPVSWHALLGRVEQLAATSPHDWCMLCDADELRYSDRPQETLLEGFARVQLAGFNAIGFRIFTFHPTEDDGASYNGLPDPEQYFRYYSRDFWNERIGQAKAWRNQGPVSLAASAGHRVQFAGANVYRSFLSKHYPIRSQQHGERKVFQERNWLDPAQGRTLWHMQYKDIAPGTNFLKDPATLERWPCSESAP